MPLTTATWPRAIAHVDADAFFASVEQSLDPKLKGCPVITGAERGIVAAASYEAKARGVKRGMPLYEVTRVCPQCILLPSDYETYSIFSKRMFAIMRDFTPEVEEYSIDEAFLDLSGMRRVHRAGYREMGLMIQEAIRKQLGISVSVGVSLSKSTAKLCSRFRKPAGVTVVAGHHIDFLLKATPLEKVWGFGPNTVALLTKYGLRTALDFAQAPQAFVRRLLGKVGDEIWRELRGEVAYPVQTGAPSQPLSISKCKTFTPAISDRNVLWARILRNLENACQKARRHGQAAGKVTLLMRTRDFSTEGMEAKLPVPTSSPSEMAPAMAALFEKICRTGVTYRATGVVLSHLSETLTRQFSLFEDPAQALLQEKAFQAVDALDERFGKHTVFLANGLCLPADHLGARAKRPQRKDAPLPGETARQRIRIPLLAH